MRLPLQRNHKIWHVKLLLLHCTCVVIFHCFQFYICAHALVSAGVCALNTRNTSPSIKQMFEVLSCFLKEAMNKQFKCSLNVRKKGELKDQKRAFNTHTPVSIIVSKPVRNWCLNFKIKVYFLQTLSLFLSTMVIIFENFKAFRSTNVAGEGHWNLANYRTYFIPNTTPVQQHCKLFAN